MDRLEGYLLKWMDLSETSRTFEGLKEQFICSCDEELALFLNERTPLELPELTTLAEKYVQVGAQVKDKSTLTQCLGLV